MVAKKQLNKKPDAQNDAGILKGKNRLTTQTTQNSLPTKAKPKSQDAKSKIPVVKKEPKALLGPFKKNKK